jgi:hypothetical protein
MRIVARYSFNNGEAVVSDKYPHLLAEIEAAVADIDALLHKTKISKEITMTGATLYSPSALNKEFKKRLYPLGWTTKKVYCDYSTRYYAEGYTPPPVRSGQKPFREMDFLKEGLGVEVQFGKYAFMVYNVCAKMTIFRNMGIIDTGIEIVPVHGFTQDMSTGVAYFEQFTWDLEQRGVGDIDIPVLILGIDADVLIPSAAEAEAGQETSEVEQQFNLE